MRQLGSRLRKRIDWLSPLSRVSAGLGYAKEALDNWIIQTRRHRNQGLLRTMHEGILSTPPIRCNPAAKVEVHTVTAHHHLTMYLTALKSLLRYYSDLAVVVHDDGTLERDSLQQLKQHVDGIKIITRCESDARMQSVLAGFPYARALRGRVVNSIELFDNILLAETDRVINMNSDVLFLRDPVELVAWIAREESSCLGVYEERPAGQERFLLDRACPLPPHVTTALTCFHRDVYDLSFVENVLTDTTPDWFTAQNIYPLLYHRQQDRHPVRYFDRESYQASGIFTDSAVFKHYWTSTGLFADLQASDSKRVIGELQAPNA
jgi:hypothetical protein